MSAAPTPRRQPASNALSSVPDRVLSPTRNPAADARRAARREQLRDFYGIKRDGPSPAGGVSGAAGGLASPGPGERRSGPGTPRAAAGAAGSGTSTPGSAGGTAGTGAGDRRDMSSPAFVPAEYYEDLIARASLPELLKTTSTLATGE